MRSVALPFSCVILATFLASIGCNTPAIDGTGTSGSADSDSTGSKKSSKSPGKAGHTSTSGDDDDATSGDDDDGAPAGNTGDDDDNGATAAPASKFACSGAGIATFADALVKAGRKSCTSAGTGVVNNQNYQCVKTAIDGVAPPHPDTSYSIVTTLLAPNQDFPDLECTYFIQMVTSGVCGTPLSPSDMKWQDYPLAKEFIGKAPAGWTWTANTGKSADVQLGDIFVYNGQGTQDPGHIMIVAEIQTGGKFRIAEANELNDDGSAATDETGVMSNTRVTSLNDSRRPVGWFRLAAQ